MKQLILLISLASVSISSFAQCNGRYASEIFTATQDTTVEYTDVYDWGLTDWGLDMDVYTPVGDTATDRPLIIFAHGGSFYLGNKDNVAMVELCEAFARRGYVTASIQYRLTNIWNLTDSIHMLETVMNAIGDAKAAIRYFRKDVDLHGNTFGIDEDQIYMGGYSAGAIIAANLAFIDDTSETPAYVDSIIVANGGVEGNSGNPGYSSQVKAVASLAGAVYKTGFIDSNDEPIVSVHATDDQTVLYNCGPAMNNSLMAHLCGSGSLHSKADQEGVYNALHTFSSGGHTIPVTSLSNVSIPFISDFLYTTLDCYTPTSVEEEQVVSSIYPNPSNTYFEVSFSDSERKEMRLFNINGQQVLSTTVSHQDKINIELLPPGLYVVQLFGKDTYWQERLLVQ
jgi:poly(3-hydroxybutyrate) depolymerase